MDEVERLLAAHYSRLQTEFLHHLQELSESAIGAWRHWKKNPGAVEELHLLRDRIHTIKGGSGIFGFEQVCKVALNLDRMLALNDSETLIDPEYTEKLELVLANLIALIDDAATTPIEA